MMRRMPERSDDPIEKFLGSLPPAPESWVERAAELPKLEQALAVLEEGSAGNGDLTALRHALEAVGLEPDDRRVRALTRLRELRREGGG
jgi:hypothetical protein